MTDSEHDINFPKVLCNLCEQEPGKCDDPDLGKVCTSCWHLLEHVGLTLRAITERS